MKTSCDLYKQRGHMRSASLENANSFLSKNTIGLPTINAGYTGTLKSRNEQRSLKNKYGSYNNLEDYAGKSKAKFQNLRSMFETKTDSTETINTQKQTVEFNENLNILEADGGGKSNCSENSDQAKNLLRPIAFKPIPFEPDYSIPNRYPDICDRYGSTPSLVPMQGPNMKFGSTSDLRYGYNNYCSSYLARRRCSRTLKINDSMESIRHTPDSDATSQNSITKCSNKFLPDQYMTPSPSDSGISELEAALKDRDSELSYLRQTMEHNEKVIFKVHKDKEVYWEQEIKRLKAFYDNQQREHLLKIKKLEQMLTLQSFQFKQNKLRLSEDSTRLKEQYSDLKSENELLRSESDGLKTTERTMRDRVNQLEEKISVMDKLILNLKDQLEENEWTVCQKNGEIALLKTQLKEAKVELTLKDHELVHVKTENQGKAISNYEVGYSEIASEKNSKLETSQLNQIIILKDQVILALTNELAKLRKELSDLAIFHEYGEKPSGKYARLKHKIDHLSSVCSQNGDDNQNIYEVIKSNKPYEDNDLEIIVNCFKMIRPQESDEDFNAVKSNTDFKDNKYPLALEYSCKPNLPDITQNLNNMYMRSERSQDVCEDGNMRKQLDELKKLFETEKKQWVEEKEKVLKYQRQLQMHYINMYQKMKELEGKVPPSAPNSTS